MTVIPDMIEPYVGWKALRIRDDGRLYSPQQDALWPVGKRLEAACNRKDTYGWVATKHADPPTHTITTETTWHTTTSTLVVPVPANPLDLPSPPATILPTGWSWVWTLKPHVPGEEGCSCGIYVVDTIKQTEGYANASCVFCKVALWGQVTIAHQGARGQYAYPQQMLIPNHLNDVGPMVADLYQIPYKTPVQPNPQIKTTDTSTTPKRMRKEARLASEGFALLSVPCYIAAIALAIWGTDWYRMPTIFAIVCSILMLMAYRDSKR